MPSKKRALKSTSSQPKKETRPGFFERRAVKKAAKHKQQLLDSRYSNRLSHDDLVNLESQWGGTLFGPVPAGHRREFFEHKKNVWIWYEGWYTPTGAFKEVTIRYEVRPAGVFKRVSGQKYERLDGEELNNFRQVARDYLSLMKAKLYY